MWTGCGYLSSVLVPDEPLFPVKSPLIVRHSLERTVRVTRLVSIALP